MEDRRGDMVNGAWGVLYTACRMKCGSKVCNVGMWCGVRRPERGRDSAENEHEGQRLGDGEGITQGGNSAFSENRDQRADLVNQERVTENRLCKMKHTTRNEEKEGYTEEDMVSGARAMQGRVCSMKYGTRREDGERKGE